MANPYVYNVVTVAGAALIAQATAANPIVYVSALSKATAAESDADLATKPASWYDGKAGGIAAVSAVGNVARIVAVWGNRGTAQAAKSLAVTARLASQSDSEAVVMTAMSDPDSAIILPGADDIQGAVEVPFNVALNASGDVEVTPGAAASVADLARFVSMYKAGDPTRGDDQAILGIKTFLDQLCVDFVGLPANSQRNGVVFDANIIPSEDNVFGLGMTGYAWAGVRAWEVHTTSLENGLDAAPDAPIYVYSSLRPSGSISLGDASHMWKNVYAEELNLSNFTLSYDMNEDAAKLDVGLIPTYDSSYNLGTSDHRWQYLYCVEVVTAQVTSPGRECTLKASQSMLGEAKFICDLDSAPVHARIYVQDEDSGGEDVTFYFDYAKFYAISSFDNVDLGTSDHAFGTVFARYYRGCIPAVDGTAEPEVGAIFFAGIEVAGAINAGVGRTAKVGSPLVQGGSNVTAIGPASWDTQTADFSAYTPFSTTAGTYKLLCGATKTGSTAACFALVMRIA